MRHAAFINRLSNVEHLYFLLLQPLEERAALDSLPALGGDVVNYLLRLCHTTHEILDRGEIIDPGWGVNPCKLVAVGRIPVDSHLDNLSQLFVERFLIVYMYCKLSTN